jgi:hypothetical protein
MMASDITNSRTLEPPYLVPTAAGVDITPLVTVGDSVGGYRMVGIPDGLGAFDNGDDTFTVLMNHELPSTLGVVRDHGAVGAFVSIWVIEKDTLNVQSGDDLIKSIKLWDVISQSYVDSVYAMNRLCSADLPAPTAFFNAASGLGTRERIFMTGEEVLAGKGFAAVVATGVAYELPWLGKLAFENAVASPIAQDKTIVVGFDDTLRNFSSEGAVAPSEVYVYIGSKKSGTGNPVADAGLVGGSLHALRVGVAGSFDANESTVISGERFGLVSLGDVSGKSQLELQADSIANTVTQFRRVEEGHWDPNNPKDFYFSTTDAFGGTTRLWRLRFDDITNPEAGGTIEIIIDSPAGVPGEMFDNVTVDTAGHVLIQEDPGPRDHVAKVWQYDISNGGLTQIAEHNPQLFTPGTPNFIASDEESSGIIDLSNILGRGYYLADVQAHVFNPDPELVEKGQLVLINTSAPDATLDAGVLRIHGTTYSSDDVEVTRNGGSIRVTTNGQSFGPFARRDVQTITIDASAGDDEVTIAANIFTPAILLGGAGHDMLHAGGGRSLMIGGDGRDVLHGGLDSDLLIGGTTAHDGNAAALLEILEAWQTNRSFQNRIDSLALFLNDSTVFDDGDLDRLFGARHRDWFWTGSLDVLHAKLKVAGELTRLLYAKTRDQH